MKPCCFSWFVSVPLPKASGTTATRIAPVFSIKAFTPAVTFFFVMATVPPALYTIRFHLSLVGFKSPTNTILPVILLPSTYSQS